MPLLEVRDLEKRFSSQVAVDKISFQLEKGSIFGLLGPNGAGKTTLIRMITGIFYPDAGSINFQDRPFQPLTDALHIGYMPEERGLYKKMKIGEQAIYLAQLKGLSRKQAVERIKHWFVRLEMQSWWDKKVEDLSKGMGQKLQFVITVLHEPQLIILDEPFSGLDPVNSNLIKDEIFNLARKGATIIFSTHRMEQVEEICDHIILVNKGQKILDGTVASVKQQFKENSFRIKVEGSMAAPDNWPPAANPDNPVPQSPAFNLTGAANGHWIVKINEGYQPNDVLTWFIDNRQSIMAFTEILPSLNDIFIRQVKDTPATRQFLESVQ